MRITEKRALLFKEWLLAVYANNEEYYFGSLYTCIPDGTSCSDLLKDLSNGWYDYCLDNMIESYGYLKRQYSSDGWYICGVVYDTENAAVDAIKHELSVKDISVPEKIYKTVRL